MMITARSQASRRATAGRRPGGPPASRRMIAGSACRQTGLGIIEVLVAIVVVSFGVLGMASLQLTGMKQSTGSYHRTKALALAEDMVTRLRINTPAVRTDLPADQEYASLDTTAGGFSCETPPVPWCQASPATSVVPACSSAELAAFDFFAVACGTVGGNGASQGVVGSLPDGRLQVSCIPAVGSGSCEADSLYQIDVSWTEGSATRLAVNDVVTRRVQMRLRP